MMQQAGFPTFGPSGPIPGKQIASHLKISPAGIGRGLHISIGIYYLRYDISRFEEMIKD